MIRATWERLTKWWDETAAQWLLLRARELAAVLDAWWGDLAENPKLHFVSMIFGMALLYAVKLAVWLVK